MHTSRLPSPIDVLKDKRQRLIARLLRGDASLFMQHHAEILDDYFRESFARSLVGPRMRVDKNPYAIIALGGYGRKEQCLHSDVDVLLLFNKEIPAEAKDLVREILYPLWDLGLDLGYATRSVKECLNLASRDFEVLTSLMDARFVCGISSLHFHLVEQLHSKVLQRRRRVYVGWLAEREGERHARFGDASHLVEPNLKDGLGGLRDYHTMMWVAHAFYGVTDPRDLEFLGHLSHDEFRSLSQALSFISTVRNWLHYLAGRRCDQLYLEHQVKLAQSLGFNEENGQLAVERFLGALHAEMESVKRQHLMFFGKGFHMKLKSGRRKSARRTLTTGIEVIGEVLHFESPEAILEDSALLMKIFERSAILGIPISVETVRLVKEFLYLVDDKFRRSRKVIRLFERILTAPPQTVNVLGEMLNTGMMSAFIPEIKGVINRIQYDVYHVYPIDKHLLRTVQILKEFRHARLQPQDGLFRDLSNELSDPKVLLWAGLLHDVGKGGQGHDHAGRGSQIAKHIFKRMGFSAKEIDTISFLVREHLLLIHTATRRDMNDEKVVVQCARKLRDIEYLKMLYLLTVADSKATGPKAWNDWIAALLNELFFKLYHILEKGELATQAAAHVVKKKKQKLFETAGSLPREALEELFEQMSPRYLLYTPSKDILKHIELYKKLGQESFVLDVKTEQAGYYRTATVGALDFPGLFSKIAGVFTLNNLDILSAEIYTWRNHVALDIFRVKPPPDTIMEDEVWSRVKDNLQATLRGELALESALDQKVQAYRSLQKEILRKPDQIVVDNESSDFFTVIEIYTHDYPGLLYKITDALFCCKLNIWVAKIATEIDQVVDVFYVRDFDGQKVDSPEQVAAIKVAIKEALTSGQLRGFARIGVLE
jgi:[protein-PII] uridylyltransferase